MVKNFRNFSRQYTFTALLIVVAVLALAYWFGQRATVIWLERLALGLGGLILLAQPILALPVLVVAALVVPIKIPTGTDVNLNPVAVLVPVMAAIWLLDGIRAQRVHFVRSRVNVPLVLFLAAGLISLAIGRITWSMVVPVTDRFYLVQLAQWGLFAFSALAFWMTANLVKDERWLWRLTAFFLLVAGCVALARLVPGLGSLVSRISTVAFIRASFWVLLAALTGGQLLWNRRLSLAWQLFLGAVLLAALIYAFVEQQEAVSNWVGLVAVLGTLVWLRFPRLRWPLMVLVVLLTALGVLVPAAYQFGGGDAEWQGSGASRIVLIQRVLEVSMRNPITGLGPAAYRRYAAMEPLAYGRAFWVAPAINAHNNYVDIFAQMGVVGLALFAWFAVEVARLGYRLHRRYDSGFKAAYVNSMLATGAGALVIMLFADWILPFVYNIGFLGFQASVLVWLFMGGLVALESMERQEDYGTST